MSENNPVVAVDTDAARSKTKNFVARHRPKLTAAALTVLTVGSFVAGRASKNVVESVDIDVNRPDDAQD